jgi:hypothetical protein
MALSSEVSLMDNEWTIKPKVGFGLISFGMDTNQVAAFSSVYGPLETVTEDADQALGLDDTLAFFSQFASQEDIAAVRGAIEDKAAQRGRQEIFNNGRVFVIYEADRVVSIMASSRESRTNFKDISVFDTAAVDVLRLFEKANGAPGRYRSTQAAFDHIGVSLDAFSLVESGKVQALTASDERFPERTIEVRKEAYISPEEAGSFVVHSVF